MSSNFESIKAAATVAQVCLFPKRCLFEVETVRYAERNAAYITFETSAGSETFKKWFRRAGAKIQWHKKLGGNRYEMKFIATDVEE